MPRTRRLTIGVLFGGRSVEHEISVITGLQLIGALDVTRYDAVPIYIAPSGGWYTGEALLDESFYHGLPSSLAAVREVFLPAHPPCTGVRLARAPRAQIEIDVFVPALHGSYGEDGCIQGLLELAGAAYAGCDPRSAAIGMHKGIAKRLARSAGVPALRDYVARVREGRADLARVRSHAIEATGGFPLVVKPASLGSSIGVRIARDARELDAALLSAFEVDTEAIVEPYLESMVEINVAVLDGDPPLASVIEVPHATGGLLSYADKYLRESGDKVRPLAGQGMAGLARAIDPEGVDAAIKARARDAAVRVFDAIGCSGVARLDFMLETATGELWFNEINTLPGSLAFYLWSASDPALLYPELLHRLIERALLLHHEKAALRRDEPFRALPRMAQDAHANGARHAGPVH